ncbi:MULTISPECIES: response regulator transcription factor [Nocardioides]|uniref:Response regulator transcription factor n=1 Tax=Nocardioides vastitatis TaxID=2568655 RepID=A0ABW0ZLR6_9ACTN|nr:response regulator transcription factor [Nocardioides sp.]THJ00713.1 response regulator transcription factor [Nocardioides sp.]
MRLLVVEDDVGMADLLRRALAREGYAVDVAATGEDGLWSASENAYDAVLLDVMIPAPDGIALVQELRRRGHGVPVLMLSARDEVRDRVAGLTAGADDYLPKPFALAELFARVRALTRREEVAETRLRAGELVLDEASHQVWRRDTPIDLTPREFHLLRELMRHPGEVVTRDQLIRNAWDAAYTDRSNNLDVYIRYLRNKVDRPFGTQILQTVRGAGFRLATEASLSEPAEGR